MKKVLVVLALTLIALPAFAEDAASTGAGLGALAAAIAIGLGAVGGTLGQGKAVSSALESIGRNPASSDKLFIPMLLGLAFIESLVILAFVIAFLVKGA